MNRLVSAVLDRVGLAQFPPTRQVAKLRELAHNAFMLSEIMHVPDSRQTLVGAAVSYAEAADELERTFYPASRAH